jgi:glycosyltransferase involved in cell wall biosynthesis
MIAMVVPCFNEEKRMIISKWQTIVDEFPECHWFFINDGSTDGTSHVLNKLTGENVFKLDLSRNHGKGNAIRAGFDHALNLLQQPSQARVDYSRIGYIDSDGAFDLYDIRMLFSAAQEKMDSMPGFKVIIGSRVKLAGRQIQRNKRRHYLGRLISTFICLGWEKAPYDTQSGFKIFDLDSSFREAVNSPFKTSWFFDIELILRLDTLGSLKIWEVPLLKWEEIGESSIKTTKYLNILRQIVTIRSLVKTDSKNRKI